MGDNRILTATRTEGPLSISSPSPLKQPPLAPPTTTSHTHTQIASSATQTHGKENSQTYLVVDHAIPLTPTPSVAPLTSPPLVPTPTPSLPTPAKYAHPHSPNPTHLATTVMDYSSKPAYAASAIHAYANTHATSPPVYNGYANHNPYDIPTHTQAPPPIHQQHQPYLRPVGSASAAQAAANYEPTMDQLLAGQSKGLSSYHNRMADRDSTMSNATGVVSWRKGQGFKEWEKVRLNSAEVKRKADVAQLCSSLDDEASELIPSFALLADFYDHYFDLLTYLHARKCRLATFKASAEARSLSPEQEATEWNSYKGRERVLLRKRRTKLQLDQFHILVQVGQGGYGEVYLARHKETNQVVALKKMKKKTLLKMDEIRHVLTERDILASTNSPWLVRLLYAFQDPTHVYLAMDFIAGGDFRTLLNNSGVLKEEHARFYISEMFCAVTELHKLGYIHRDLKPENFLIDPSGHIKLTDFGLAAGALNPGKIENLKHKLDEVKDRELIYRSTIEMKSMYKSIRMAEPRYPEETWVNLKNWSKTLRRPHYDRPEDRIFNLSDVGWSAITSLIQTKDRRLSTLDAVKAHPFFANVDWAGLRDSKAPFIPALDSEVDSGYFDDFTSEADMKKYAEVREKQANVDKVREKDEKFNRGVFAGFTFKARKDKPEDPVEFLEGDDELVTLF
ncbi:cell cycle protein kinase DBF2, partial [Phenoliferia sp. Uapishka_3]